MTEYQNLASPDDQILTDLQTCISAVDSIGREQARIRDEIEITQNPIRKKYLWWQHDYIDLYVGWAAKNAESRLRYLETLSTVDAQIEEVERCQKDILHWFRAWAWTLDPRMTILPVIPFVPFKFQAKAILWIDNLIRIHRSDCMVDKARTQGLSWIVIGLAVHYFRFIPFAQMMFGSYKEDLVDSKKNPDTLLEKARFMLRRQPRFLLPEAFNAKRDMAYMSITNESTGALIKGAAPTENFARAGRYTMVVLDEHAAWPFGGYPQWTAASQAGPKVSITTPRGKGNQQADLRFGNSIPVLSLHWKNHPWLDDRWYEGQGLTMSAQQKAQELNIDYEASQPGKIFGMYHEAYHVVTWSEFEKRYGVRHIPRRWLLGSCQDIGTTEGHEVTTDWFAKPPENDPLFDTVFWYRNWVSPIEWSIRQIAEGKWSKANQLDAPGIWQREKDLKEDARMAFRYLSWEGKSEAKSYAEDCPRYRIDWTNIRNPGSNEGIAQAQNLMTLLPEPHPFAIHPQTGEPLFGRPRLIMIVDDEQGELHCDESGFLFRTQPVDEEGLLNPRTEIGIYHYPAVAKGKPAGVLKPFKRADNSMDNLRYATREWGPPAAGLTRVERLEKKMPEALKRENLPTPSDQKEFTSEEISAIMMARTKAEKEILKEMQEEDSPRRKRGRERKKPTRRTKGWDQ